MPEPDYVIFNKAIEETCVEKNIQCVPFFLEKVQQLYEMIIVRHGLMIVGLPFGGKTTSYRILAKALALIEKRVSNLVNYWMSVIFFFSLTYEKKNYPYGFQHKSTILVQAIFR